MKSIDIGYAKIRKDFYRDQTLSRNPLRKWFHLNRYRIGRSLVKSKYQKGSTIVDLGCASAEWNTEGLPVFGIDVNEGFLEAAQQKGSLCGYKAAQAWETGLAASSFDIVTAFEFLEHVPDYRAVIREAKRLLRDGGYCIVSVPYDVLFSLWKPLFACQVLLQGYILRDAYYRKRCGHVNHFSVDSIRKAFTDEGFCLDTVFVMRGFTIFLCARKGPAAAPASYKDLTIILPTLNEEDNIADMLGRLSALYPGARIIVTDDGSKDRTKERVTAGGYEHVLFIDRSARSVHGLTASILEAVQEVKTPYFIVTDADGQHPIEKIEEINAMLRSGAQLVVASRVAVEAVWPLVRKVISYAGSMVGKIVLLAKGKNYLSYDILSGFFGCNTRFARRYTRQRAFFRPRGYKILFDLLKCVPSRLKIEEVYYVFRSRKHGLSKLNTRIYLEYLVSCLR